MHSKLTKTCLALALIAGASTAMAQQTALPSTIRMIVPFAPGATTDLMARAAATELAKRLGNTVVVENQPGASTFIGVGTAARAPKDGSVLLMTSVSTFTAAATKRTMTVDVLKDIVPVSLLSESPIAVAASLPSGIKTPNELIAAARAKPDIITHGTAGIGTLGHIAAEMFNDGAKVHLKHIPYKGASLAIGDFVAGRVDLMFGTYSTTAPQIKAGKARLVGITSAEPHPVFPGVPTIASVIPGYSVTVWGGFFVPEGTPTAIILRLNRELNEVAKSNAVLEILEPDAGSPKALTPEEFAVYVRDSYAGWKSFVTAKNILLD